MHFIVIGFFGYLPEIWFNEYIFNGEIVGGGGGERGKGKEKDRLGKDEMRGKQGKGSGTFY